MRANLTKTMHIYEMNNHDILTMSVLLLTILVLTFQTHTNLLFPQTLGQLPIPSVKPNLSNTATNLSNHMSSICIHTLNTIQANNFCI
jgi:hypothetical protein